MAVATSGLTTESHLSLNIQSQWLEQTDFLFDQYRKRSFHSRVKRPRSESRIAFRQPKQQLSRMDPELLASALPEVPGLKSIVEPTNLRKSWAEAHRIFNSTCHENGSQGHQWQSNQHQKRNLPGPQTNDFLANMHSDVQCAGWIWNRELSDLQGEAHCQTRDQSGQWHHGDSKFVAEAFGSQWRNVPRKVCPGNSSLLRIDPDQKPFHLKVAQTKLALNSFQPRLSLDAQICSCTVLMSSDMRLHLFAAWQCSWGMCVKPSNISMQHGVEVPETPGRALSRSQSDQLTYCWHEMVELTLAGP